MNRGMHRSYAVALALAIAVSRFSSPCATAQTTLTPWGTVTGMRVDGEPVDFEAGLRLVDQEWSSFSSAVKYLQRPRYSRADARGTVHSEIEGISFTMVLEDVSPSETRMALTVTAKTNAAMAGAYYCLELPDAEFANATLEFVASSVSKPFTLSATPAEGRQEYLRHTVTGVRIAGPRRTLDVEWSEPRSVVVRRDASSHPTLLNDPSVRQQLVCNRSIAAPTGYQVYLELFEGNATPGRAAGTVLRFKAHATPDRQAVRLVLDVTMPGRVFDGIGGNFRLQFPETDPAVLEYNLDHLRVAWGRVDMPWAEWDPVESLDPLAVARSGSLNPRVANAMETARTLARRRIPVIISAWSPPQWARATSQPPSLRGTALNLDKMDRICASLASYLMFLKEHHGVEAFFFSFNEPEIGVEVRQTPAEHVQFIQCMGAELARRSLATRLLLGDTAHGTPAALDFIRPALADPGTHPYIGGVAFHTWRGCTADSLPGWADAARQLGVPLLITESGPDAHLHEYPRIRLEPWFQLQEIELYLRCCALSQPATIMQWQLTTDYSVLTGNGIYGEAGPLRPTQRFWNLKQLGSTPAGAFALPIRADHPVVTCAAFGDLANQSFAVHIVNRGNQRPAVLDGLPPSLTRLRQFITDAQRGMEEGTPIEVRGGRTEFILPVASYTTLLGTGAIQKQLQAPSAPD